MASGSAFRSNPLLQQFILTDVAPTGKKLGSGSYGSVEEVKYRQAICAGKRLHETLLNVENEGVNYVMEKFLQECQLMSRLCHPNITQFFGICFLPGIKLPLLVMERLETSLGDLLEFVPNLPLSLKRSILEDIASGLFYLHMMQPPVIHRDLTSRNILLTSSLKAKITDMGNSRIVDVRPGQMAKTLTEFPGTLVYMPPEALDDRHSYGPSLDIFSFGHLALYTITQEFPGVLLPSTYYNPDNVDAIQGRTELQRREKYIKLLDAHIGAVHPAAVLAHLIKQRLHNVPEQRPISEKILTVLQGMRVKVEGEYGEPIKLDLAKVRLAKEMKEAHEARMQMMKQVKADQHVQELSDQIQQQQKPCIATLVHTESPAAEQENEGVTTTPSPHQSPSRMTGIPSIHVTAVLPEGDGQSDPQNTDMDRTLLDLTKFSMSNKAPENWAKGKYLGSGAFGQVYICHDNNTGRVLAIKEVKIDHICESTQSQREIKSFESELQLFQNLRHERVVLYYGSERKDGKLCIFMEYMPGGSVYQHLRDTGAYNECLTRKYTKQILEGIIYLHNNRIVHRDVKGANILRDSHGNIKLADFGASRRLQTLHTGQEGVKSTRGTFYWMAPEVIKGEPYSERVDIWSIGATIVEMLTCHPPWFDFEPVAATFKVATCETKPDLPAHCSKQAHEFLALCFIKDQSQRPMAKELLKTAFVA